MTMDFDAARKCLKAFDFETLFREHLGWDRWNARLEVSVGGASYLLEAVAQKRGFVAFVCSGVPDRQIRLKIDRQVAKSAREHFVIYADKQAGRQVWNWVRRTPGEPLASRDHVFEVRQSGDPLLQRLAQIAVSLEEEEGITVVDVAGRARAAFDVDKVTKKFYERFKAEHAAFHGFVKGISDGADSLWYASLMLNRLMFVYFIQKKGFLDGDPDYLRNRLQRVRRELGDGRFLSFYRCFLLRLFHDGLGKPPQERAFDPALAELIGEVPFLDGGFFEVHDLEERWPDIEIPDEAFENLFDFFDQYAWHLDERPLRADNEINPDVVGYIFEKYVNQKQMGAYYTKEDITEYIAKNTIVPFLFDAAEKECAIAFAPGSALWGLLAEDPDRYIYPAVKHGVVAPSPALPESGEAEAPETAVVPESALPGFVRKGMADPKARMHDSRYNLAQAPAGDPIRLPTETWREYASRRQRCLELREKLRTGQVCDINDLVTLNLDIWQFARDAIVNAEGPELLRAFWKAIRSVSVLDPTCGSGAFLFAALRILETLYCDCLERMEQFVEEPGGGTPRSRRFKDFKAVLADTARHPSQRYFVLKSIILNNLYGVDIMREAVEICKLRLFLKLVAQVERAEDIEPLPDMDFNIRAGNTLVGFATLEQVRQSRKGILDFGEDEIRRIEEEAETVERAFRQFRAQQTRHGGKVTSEDKRALRERLGNLGGELDRYLAQEYGVNPEKTDEFGAWKGSHQPFHWFSEFYGIVQTGGFDVIIGNPPYISTSQIRKVYILTGYLTSKCSDIYANIQERCLRLLSATGRCGMIVPLSLGFSSYFQTLRDLLFSEYAINWFSSYGRIPSALFSADVRVRNTIHIGAKNPSVHNSNHFTTVLHRWFGVFRCKLFASLSYVQFDPDAFLGLIPKINTQSLSDAFSFLSQRTQKCFEFSLAARPTKYPMYFKKSAYNWLTFCKDQPPCFDSNGKSIAHTKYGTFWFEEKDARDIALLFLNGKIMFAFWCMIGDDFDVTRWMFASFPALVPRPTGSLRIRLLYLCKRLEACMQGNVSFKQNAGKRIGNYNLAKCRSITDESDAIFAKLFGLQDFMDDIELMCSQLVKTAYDTDLCEED